MRRWLVASIGLALAAAAIYALLTGVFEGNDAASGEKIDDRSREELRELLRKTEAGEADDPLRHGAARGA